MSETNWFNPVSPDEKSQDIVVSFASRWYDLLKSNSIRYVFRRQYPKPSTVKQMYIYVSRPHSLILGFSDIIRIEAVTLLEALSLLHEAQITRGELEKYFEGYTTVGRYHISDLTLFSNPISLEKLRTESGFSPPQSFSFLSKRAVMWLKPKHDPAQPKRVSDDPPMAS